MDHDQFKGLISVNQASKMSGLSPRHIRLLLSQGKIIGFKMGRDWFTTEEAVKNYLSQNPKPGPKPQQK
jgi:excisionase family DNA binding protein